MAISPHFHLHVINSSSAQRRVKQLHVGRPKHVTTQKKRYGGARERKRKETKFVDTRFCHAGAVCRPARAQRPELKLRNTDRLSQLLPYTHPPCLSSPPPLYPVIYLSFSPFSILSISLVSPKTITSFLCHAQCPYTSVLLLLFSLQPSQTISICRQTFVPLLLRAFLFMS